MPQHHPTQNWFPAMTLVVALHFAAWWGLTHVRDRIESPKALPEINVALLPPPPAPPRVEPPPPRTPPPPQAKAPPPSRPQQPVTQPVLTTQAAEAPAIPAPPAPETAKPVAAAPAPVAPPAPSRPAPEPALELPRYNADYLNNPPPAYPLAARRRGIEGTVLVRAEISTEGTCLRVELKKSSGTEMLDQTALDAVKKWRFVPARRGAQAVTAWVEVPVTFKLDG